MTGPERLPHPLRSLPGSRCHRLNRLLDQPTLCRSKHDSTLTRAFVQILGYLLACAVVAAMAHRLGRKALGVLGAATRSDRALPAEVLTLRQQTRCCAARSRRHSRPCPGARSTAHAAASPAATAPAAWRATHVRRSERRPGTHDLALQHRALV